MENRIFVKNHFLLHLFRYRMLLISISLLFLVSCSPLTDNTPQPTPTPRPSPTTAPVAAATTQCPSALTNNSQCYTPYDLRVAYAIESLTQKGFTGKGQTIVDIVSYGSPTLQQDMDVFDKQFGLPSITIQVLSPLGKAPVNSNNPDIAGWAGETELDVQIIHAIAPDAHIIVMTSPVDETEGTVGMPEFLKLEQYAVSHHLGQVFSQSFVASEATLSDTAGQQLVQNFTNFYKTITTQQGWTIVSGSGDHGATDYTDLAGTKLSPTPIVNFPADVPWVTAVGGTSLVRSGNTYKEVAWSGSGGGVSKFFTEPDFQRSMPQSVQAHLAGHRGLPDIAADANPYTGMAFYFNRQWQQTGGTSASTPFWAALVAIADQMAGHPLGYINPGIYKVAQSKPNDFRDIMQGNNYLSGNSQGFAATPGWDAVTGWGTPQAAQLLPDLIATLQ